MTHIKKGDKEEMALIEELKKQIINETTPKMLEDEHLWHRFLKARDYNLKAAEDMMRKHIQFRKEYGVDNILTEWQPSEVLAKYGAMTNMCIDKEGKPVIYLDLSCDAKGLVDSVKRDDFIRFGCWTVEKSIEIMKKQNKKFGTNIYQLIFILNCDKMTFAQATTKKGLELMLLALTVFQDHFPERIQTAYVINGSVYFSMMWSVVKNFLAPALIKKFKIYGIDKWRDDLLKDIDENELPAFLGGKRTDPDGNPLCPSVVVHSSLVPESYYMRKSERKLYLSAGVKRLTVTRFSKAELTFEITTANSYLEWEFETKNKDIAFAVYFRAVSVNKPKSVEIVPKQRIDTCFGPETGMYKCETPGTYVLMFDNSYSWFYPKEIYYKTKIVVPNEDGSGAIEPLA